MTIVENSPSWLRLRESSGYLPAILGCAAILIAAFAIAEHKDPKQLINAVLFAVAAVFFRRESRIALDRSARRCCLWRRDMWRHSCREIGFDEIKDVQVELQSPNTSVQNFTRLSLETSAGALPLTAGFRADLDNHLELRERIVDVIFAGRQRPAPLDPVQLLAAAGRIYRKRESAH